MVTIEGERNMFLLAFLFLGAVKKNYCHFFTAPYAVHNIETDLLCCTTAYTDSF